VLNKLQAIGPDARAYVCFRDVRDDHLQRWIGRHDEGDVFAHHPRADD
jgi:hypothetical protein